MAWTNSKVFGAFLEDSLARTAALDLNSDTFRVALYGNITPDNTVSAALSAYNAATSQWVTANEIWQTGQWAQAGPTLSGVSYSRSGAVVTWDAADNASGSAATLTGVYGCLVYDDTIATPVSKQGVCYNYFGGVATVTAGTFTVVWNASGIATFSAA